MKNKLYRSKTLGLHYRKTETGIKFEDGVEYSNTELEILKNCGSDIKTIHAAKCVFDGELLSEAQVVKLEEHYKSVGNPIKQAADYAAKLIREGLSGVDATRDAASKHGVSQAAVGRELGRRKGK